MSGLHLLRIPIDAPRLLRFASAHGIKQEDETLGYTLHAWFASLFGVKAPKPFRYIERRREVLGYSTTDAATLLAHSRAFAQPQAWAALDAEGVLSKAMPDTWQIGQRLRLEVLTCPVSRQGDEEKDIYLRALDRLGDEAPPRADVYRSWFVQQWSGAIQIDQLELLAMSARSRLLRRARNGINRLRIVERPQALFVADAVIVNTNRFSGLLSRGVGRHRAFGFGMVLLSPPR